MIVVITVMMKRRRRKIAHLSRWICLPAAAVMLVYHSVSYDSMMSNLAILISAAAAEDDFE